MQVQIKSRFKVVYVAGMWIIQHYITNIQVKVKQNHKLCWQELVSLVDLQVWGVLRGPSI